MRVWHSGVRHVQDLRLRVYRMYDFGLRHVGLRVLASRLRANVPDPKNLAFLGGS